MNNENYCTEDGAQIELIKLGKAKRANFAYIQKDDTVYFYSRFLWRIEGVSLAVAYSEGLIPTIGVGRKIFIAAPWLRKLPLSQKAIAAINELEKRIRCVAIS